MHLKLSPHVSSRCLAKEAGVLLGPVLTAASQTNSVCINQGKCMILNNLLMQEGITFTTGCYKIRMTKSYIHSCS